MSSSHNGVPSSAATADEVRLSVTDDKYTDCTGTRAEQPEHVEPSDTHKDEVVIPVLMDELDKLPDACTTVEGKEEQTGADDREPKHGEPSETHKDEVVILPDKLPGGACPRMEEDDEEQIRAEQLEEHGEPSAGSKTPTGGTIHKVPSLLRSQNPTDYDPQYVSIGPYHSSNPDLQSMHPIKKSYLNDLVSRSNKNTEGKFVEAVRSRHLAHARKQYSYKPKIKDEEFLDMMVVDGCFILEFLLKSFFNEKKDHGHDVNMKLSLLKNDLLLAENQIPFQILECLFETLYIDTQPAKNKVSLVGMAILYFTGDKIAGPKIADILAVAASSASSSSSSASSPSSSAIASSSSSPPSKSSLSFDHLLHLYHSSLDPNVHRRARARLTSFNSSLLAPVFIALKLIFIFLLLIFKLIITARSFLVYGVFVILSWCGLKSWQYFMHPVAKLLCLKKVFSNLGICILQFRPEKLAVLLAIALFFGPGSVQLYYFIQFVRKLRKRYPGGIIAAIILAYIFLPICGLIILRCCWACCITVAKCLFALVKAGISIVNRLGKKQSMIDFFNSLCKGIHLDNAIKHHLTNVINSVDDYYTNKYYMVRYYQWRKKLLPDYFNNAWTVPSIVIGIFLFGITILQAVYALIRYYHPH